jgi:hypothetical protein
MKKPSSVPHEKQPEPHAARADRETKRKKIFFFGQEKVAFFLRPASWLNAMYSSLPRFASAAQFTAVVVDRQRGCPVV